MIIRTIVVLAASLYAVSCLECSSPEISDKIKSVSDSFGTESSAFEETQKLQQVLDADLGGQWGVFVLKNENAPGKLAFWSIPGTSTSALQRPQLQRLETVSHRLVAERDLFDGTGKEARLRTDLNFGAISSEFRRARLQLPRSAYFADGHRQIDLVLSYKPVFKKSRRQAIQQQFRQRFEAEMRNVGLDLENEGKEASPDGKTAFIKIHASWSALSRQAEMERLQMPIQLCDVPRKRAGILNQIMSKLFRRNPFYLPEHLDLNVPEYFTANFERSREDDFMVNDPDTFFSAQQRIYLTYSIVSGIRIKLNIRKNIRKQTQDDVLEQSEHIKKNSKAGQILEISANISYLLNEVSVGIYTSIFPLHDCSINKEVHDMDYSRIAVECWPLRKYLYESWACWQRWHTYQPIDAIKDYYGEKVGMYFAWLGFYTDMLVLPSIVGVIVFVVGIISAGDNEFTRWFCNGGSRSNPNVVFCREAPMSWSRFTKAPDLCGIAYLSRVFDHVGAPFFATFMCVWVIVFLGCWKRKQASLCARWDIYDNELDTSHIRPEYSLSVMSIRVNPVTHEIEPHLPSRSFYQRLIASVSTVFVTFFPLFSSPTRLVRLFFISIVLLLMLSVMVFKAWSPNQFLKLFTDQKTLQYISPVSPPLLASLAASVINGIMIGVMSKVYIRICWGLTSLEMPRTDTQFETSYTYKMFMFQFVNFYGALFFLAFVRGQHATNPTVNEGLSPASRCPPTGCLLDVSIQLLIIMTGKQVINNIIELCIPLFNNMWRHKRDVPEPPPGYGSRLEEDFVLEDTPNLGLFDDYLEMVIQYGFITMFVAAFPLAPLFALINNIIEIRLDAYKMLTQTKRCIPKRAKNIQPWSDILMTISKMAILTNALLIALNSSVVDSFTYSLYYGQYHNTFMDFSVHPFNTSIWCTTPNLSDLYNTSECFQLMYMKDFTVDMRHQLLQRLHNFSLMDGEDVDNHTAFHTITKTMELEMLETENSAYFANSSMLNQTSTNETTLEEINMTLFMQAVQSRYDLTLPGNEYVSKCYFRTYRNEDNDYNVGRRFYVAYMFKLFFIICFEHLILAAQIIICYLIPDVTEEVMIRVKRECYLHKLSFRARESKKSFSCNDHENQFTYVGKADSETTSRSSMNPSLPKWDIDSFCTTQTPASSSGLHRDSSLGTLGTGRNRAPTTQSRFGQQKRSIVLQMLRKVGTQLEQL